MQQQSTRARGILMPRICPQCGKEFLAWSCRIREGSGRFCTRSCGLLYAGRRRAITPEAFWSRLIPHGECLLWPGRVAKNTGYGCLSYRGKPIAAHRLSYTFAFGNIPEEFMVCHSCDASYPSGDVTYRRCCRPAHLFLGTALDNSRDMVSKGRQAHGQWLADRHSPERRPRGANNGNSRLDDATVLAIRKAFAQGTATKTTVAEQYGVSLSQASRIIRGESWKHLL